MKVDAHMTLCRLFLYCPMASPKPIFHFGAGCAKDVADPAKWPDLINKVPPSHDFSRRTPTKRSSTPHIPVGSGMLVSHLRYNMILQIGIHGATSVMQVRSFLVTIMKEDWPCESHKDLLTEDVM